MVLPQLNSRVSSYKLCNHSTEQFISNRSASKQTFAAAGLTNQSVVLEASVAEGCVPCRAVLATNSSREESCTGNDPIDLPSRKKVIRQSCFLSYQLIITNIKTLRFFQKCNPFHVQGGYWGIFPSFTCTTMLCYKPGSDGTCIASWAGDGTPCASQKVITRVTSVYRGSVLMKRNVL